MQSYFISIFVLLVAVCSMKYFSFPGCSPAVILEVGSGSGVVSAFLASMIGPSALYLWVIQPGNIFFLFCWVTYIIVCLCLPVAQMWIPLQHGARQRHPPPTKCLCNLSSHPWWVLNFYYSVCGAIESWFWWKLHHAMWSRRELCVVSSKWWVWLTSFTRLLFWWHLIEIS